MSTAEAPPGSCAGTGSAQPGVPRNPLHMGACGAGLAAIQGGASGWAAGNTPPVQRRQTTTCLRGRRGLPRLHIKVIKEVPSSAAT
jgi:hypothetical protein